MRWFAKIHKKWALVFLLSLIALAGWWHADVFWAWYSARQLAGADDAQREVWLQRVIALDIAAAPRLLDHLSENDDRRCRNVGIALAHLAHAWRIEDPRGLELLSQMTRRFANFSPSGQIESLRVTAILISGKGPENSLPALVTQEVGTLLIAAEKKEESREVALDLAGALLARVPEGQWSDWSRVLALNSLGNPRAQIRLAAIRLLQREPLRKDTALFSHLLPFLKDDSPEVRKACLIALSPSRDILGDDELLPFLHDSDLEVQAMADIALRSRGLSDTQINLARAISDPRPEARLQVLNFLHGDGDLEPGVWLQRLSRDAAPAVRAAAVRAASGQTRVDFRERMRNMAIEDPSPTVRELAGHYFRWHEQRLKEMIED